MKIFVAILLFAPSVWATDLETAVEQCDVQYFTNELPADQANTELFERVYNKAGDYQKAGDMDSFIQCFNASQAIREVINKSSQEEKIIAVVTEEVAAPTEQAIENSPSFSEVAEAQMLEKAKHVWGGKISLAFMSSKTAAKELTTSSMEGTATHRYGDWENDLTVSGNLNTTNGVKNNSYEIDFQSRYPVLSKLDKYTWGKYVSDIDTFVAYQYRERPGNNTTTRYSVGLGKDSQWKCLDMRLEGGPGLLQSETGLGVQKNQAILHLRSKVKCGISDNTDIFAETEWDIASTGMIRTMGFGVETTVLDSISIKPQYEQVDFLNGFPGQDTRQMKVSMQVPFEAFSKVGQLIGQPLKLFKKD